jgi:hypothetical protein
MSSDDAIIGLRGQKEDFVMEFQPMSPEEMQRAMQFVLSQQAQFAADMTRVEAVLGQLTAKTDRMADGILSLTGVVGHLAEDLRELAEGQQQLQQLFERHLREDHGPRPS